MSIDKYDEPDQRSDELNASNKVKQGFSDPSGAHSKKNYLFEPSTNKGERSNIRHDLSLGGGFDGLALDLEVQQESKYPHNDVYETSSGHILEFNDTPGGQRILIKHRTGSGVELRSDGSMIMKTEKNSVTSIAGSSCIIVEGEADMKYNGNLNLSVGGDFNLDVGGDINVTSGGDKIENISGSSRETVYGVKGSIVKGSRSETTVGPNTKTTLDDFNEIVKGNVKRTVQGNETHAVSDTLKTTAETEMIISTDNMNMGARDLSVFGATGTIGGSNIVHYGVTYYGTTFYGDLKGTAEFSVTADVTNSQNYSDPDPGGGVGSAQGYSVNTNTTSTASANTNTMNDYLNNSSYGSIKVSIDEGEFLKNLIDRTVENDGISDKPMTTREIRSALREPNNLSNKSFIGNSFSSGKLSNTYANTIPTGVGRISSSVGTVTVPTLPLTEDLSKIKRLTPNKNLDVTAFIPDPNYDVNDLDDNIKITGSIDIGNGIKLSRFLGGTGEKVTLSHIKTRDEKLSIARQFSLQVPAINSILRDVGEFKDYRLVVVEGLYKKGEGENLTSNSTKELATKGQVVVYELHNSQGNIDLDKTYDLALYWKDSLHYDKLELSYDTYEVSGELTAQIVLTMPEIDSSYNFVNNRYANELVTTFNNNIQGNELIEIISG